VSITRRFLDLARANITDFSQAFRRGDPLEGLSEDERRVIDEEVESDTVGTKAGKRARQVRDAAEEMWERAFEASQRAAGNNPPRQRSSEAERLRWYRTLELEPGATHEEIRKSYRRLLKQYHPDRFAKDPEKYKVATEVTRNITVAYDGLTTLLEQQR
jgi:site-specific DNA-cytosine methylase